MQDAFFSLLPPGQISGIHTLVLISFSPSRGAEFLNPDCPAEAGEASGSRAFIAGEA